MPKDFTDAEIAWLEEVAKSKAAREADEKVEKARTAALDALNGKLEAIGADGKTLRMRIAEAQDFQVTLTKEQQILFWEVTRKKSMNWSEANASKPKDKKATQAKDRTIRDVEVDSVHDLRPGFDVDEAKAQQVQKMHAELVALQEELRKIEVDGKRVFDDNDIADELWTPLVKSDVIPENAVSDTFSEEAKLFRGAAKIYEDLLVKHTEEAGPHENAQKWLGHAQSALSLMGKLTAGAMTFANFEGASMSGQELREHDIAKNEDLAQNEIVAGGGGKTREELEAQFKAKQDHAATQNFLAMGFGLLNGAFDVASQSLEKSDKARNAKIAETIIDNLGDMAARALAGDKAIKTGDGQADQFYRTLNESMANGVKSVIAGSKAGINFLGAIEAAPGDREKSVKAAVMSIADCVGSYIAIFDEQEKRVGRDFGEDRGTDGKFSNIGGWVKTAIVGTANIGAIVNELNKARETGKAPNAGLMATLLGLDLIGGAMAGAFPEMADASREQLDQNAVGANPHQESTRERDYRKLDDGANIAEIADHMKDLGALFSGTTSSPIDPHKAVEQALRQTEALEEARRKAELAEFNAALENPEYRKKLFTEIAEANEERAAELRKLMEAATPPSAEDLSDDQKLKEAMAAIDRLLAEVEATRMKIQIIDQVSKAGVGILTKFVPGAGLAVAIRQFLADLAFLGIKVKELREWKRNLALTYGNDSVYGPALTNRLAQAEIQLSQKTLNAAFSACGIAAQGLQVADVMGAGVATQTALTMAQALSDFAYYVEKEAEVRAGWNLYLQARENKGDRKIARKAMRWNSTLSKCVLAYGMVYVRDPVAKRVARNCGMTPHDVADKNQLCQKVVQYFLAVFSDDPVVLKSIPLVKDWHPGDPDLTLTSWMKFKAAACYKAVPPLAESASSTPRLDGLLAQAKDLWRDGGYRQTRDKGNPMAAVPAASGAKDDEQEVRSLGDHHAFLQKSLQLAEGLMQAFGGYVPRNGPCPENAERKWKEGALHADMEAICQSLAAQAHMLRTEIQYDLAECEAVLKPARMAAI